MKLSFAKALCFGAFYSLMSARDVVSAGAADVCQEELQYFTGSYPDFMTECECTEEASGDAMLVCADSCERCDEEAKVRLSSK
jgi:hypothetical protein